MQPNRNMPCLFTGTSNTHPTSPILTIPILTHQKAEVLKLSSIGSFDNLNPYIIKGSTADAIDADQPGP